MEWMTSGGHAIIIGLLIWIVKNIRTVKIEMKNGKHND